MNFGIINSGNEVETDGETGTAVSVVFRQNTKDFEFGNNMLNRNTLGSELAIG